MKSLKVITPVALFFLAGIAMAGKGEFDNDCVTGLSMGMEVKTDCSINTVYEGRTYCFGNEEAKQIFLKDPKAVLAKAEEAFAKMKK